jgi:O-antigen ligase
MIRNIILLIYIIYIPIIGKSIDSIELFLFYLPSILLIILEILYNRNKKILTVRQAWFLIILTFLYITSIIFSKNPGTSYYQLYIFLNVILTTVLAINNLKPQEFKKGLIVSTIVFSVIFILNKLSILPLPTRIYKDNFILQIWGHSYLGDLLILAIPSIISLFNSKNYKIPSLILILVCAVLLLTNSRSAIFALLIGLLLLKPANFTQKIFKTALLGFAIFSFVFQFFCIYLKIDSKKSLTGNRFNYWQESLLGFKDSPVLGNGPGTFSYINKKYEKFPDITNYTHNSFLWFLSENGIFFTLIVFTAIILAIITNYHQDNIFFVTSITSLVHSFFDPTWNSAGILIISLYFIFYHYLHKKNGRFKWSFFIPVSVLLLLFIVSQASTRILMSQFNYKTTLLFDPINLKARLEIIKSNNPKDMYWQSNLASTIKLFPNETAVYDTLINITPFPENEKYYYKLFELSPQENYKRYVELAGLYYQHQLFDKLDELFLQIDRTFNENQLPAIYSFPLSQICYRTALENYKKNPESSIKLFQESVRLFPMLSHYHIELANAYWNIGYKKEALAQLSVCQTYLAAKKHCQEYLNEHKNVNLPHPGAPVIVSYINSNLN